MRIWPSGARENSPHLAEVRIPSALPKQCMRVCNVDCYRQIKKKKDICKGLINKCGLTQILKFNLIFN